MNELDFGSRFIPYSSLKDIQFTGPIVRYYQLGDMILYRRDTSPYYAGFMTSGQDRHIWRIFTNLHRSLRKCMCILFKLQYELLENKIMDL